MYCLRGTVWQALSLSGVSKITRSIEVVKKKNCRFSALLYPQLPNSILVEPSKSVLVLRGQSFMEMKQAMCHDFVVSYLFKRLIVLLFPLCRVTLSPIFGSTSHVHLIQISFSVLFSKCCVVWTNINVTELYLCFIAQNIHLNILKSLVSHSLQKKKPSDL